MPSVVEKLNVVVVGAGIAGLAAATALREHNVTVLEQSRMKEEVGAAIHLGPNASKIALQWGMDLEKLNSCEVHYYHELGKDGKTHFKIPIDGRRDFSSPWLLNHRVDLHNELLRLATREDGPGSPAVVKTAAKVVRVDPEAGIVELSNGETLQADVIVAADGIHSVARSAVLGEELIAKQSGHSAYRALIPRELIGAHPNLLHYLDGDESGTGFCTFMGQDRRLVAYPCRGAQFLNIVAIVPDTEVKDSTEAWHAAGDMDELLASFSEFCDDAKQILQQATTCALWQLREQDPLSTWTKGRVILIGDAAHAMLPHQGQGGGQAVEDAEALQVVLPLGTAASSIPERLKLAEKIRYERASLIQGYSREKALGPRPGEKIVNAQEYAFYNFSYPGAKAWAEKMGLEV
ncbi:hypothetical protein BCR35DRAFT_302383 [Leucosporidium creatinivorum]|uniref:FAD-binding domain-containing protein n=1 Tax=Leucosporidium creatinivorum TaxID=106004 RepID=A0A1Y2FRQ4_9BASI|nr:hypothetical protein BCR35DRAFT_302383 [Leucosporidium creatinivorum]